jgi:hypothetical protein
MGSVGLHRGEPRVQCSTYRGNRDHDVYVVSNHGRETRLHEIRLLSKYYGQLPDPTQPDGLHRYWPVPIGQDNILLRSN